MQLIIKHKLPEELVLPIHYHHILQSIIYHNLQEEYGYSDFLHGQGYASEERQYRMFVFSLLKGRYEIHQKTITFRDEVRFEVRSADARMLRLLKENLEKKGIRYMQQHYDDVELKLKDEGISREKVQIKMLSPLIIYSTDKETKKTYFYHPQEDEFERRVNANFHRKYKAYTGIVPTSDIKIKPIKVTDRDKYVTKYKGFYLSGWLGEYELSGDPKYLDFLYQTGLGSKNAQGFGMFEVAEKSRSIFNAL